MERNNLTRLSFLYQMHSRLNFRVNSSIRNFSLLCENDLTAVCVESIMPLLVKMYSLYEMAFPVYAPDFWSRSPVVHSGSVAQTLYGGY